MKAVLGLAGAAAVALAFMVYTAQPATDHVFFAGETGVQVIAHRGGAALRPENTLIAFAHASELGADMLEMDVRMTADGAIVLMHDATVDRTTDGSGRIDALPLAGLREFDAGYRWSADGGKTFPYRGAGIRVPLLEEVFSRFAAKRMNIEMKANEPRLAQTLCMLTRKHGMSTKVLVASFHAGIMETFRKDCPEIATSLTVNEARAFYLLHAAHISALWSPAAPALQMPDRLADRAIATPELIRAARRRNLKTHTWLVNNEARMRELIAAGIDGIITDRPDTLLQVLGRANGP